MVNMSCNPYTQSWAGIKFSLFSYGFKSKISPQLSTPFNICVFFATKLDSFEKSPSAINIWDFQSIFKYSIPRLSSTSIIININSYYASNTKQIEFINCIFKISLIYIKKKYCFFFLAPKEKHNLFILFIKFITSLRKF